MFDLSSTGFDLSAIDSFVKFIQFSGSNSIRVVVAGASDLVHDALDNSLDTDLCEVVFGKRTKIVRLNGLKT